MVTPVKHAHVHQVHVHQVHVQKNVQHVHVIFEILEPPLCEGSSENYPFLVEIPSGFQLKLIGIFINFNSSFAIFVGFVWHKKYFHVKRPLLAEHIFL